MQLPFARVYLISRDTKPHPDQRGSKSATKFHTGFGHREAHYAGLICFTLLFSNKSLEPLSDVTPN